MRGLIDKAIVRSSEPPTSRSSGPGGDTCNPLPFREWPNAARRCGADESRFRAPLTPHEPRSSGSSRRANGSKRRLRPPNTAGLIWSVNLKYIQVPSLPPASHPTSPPPSTTNGSPVPHRQPNQERCQTGSHPNGLAYWVVEGDVGASISSHPPCPLGIEVPQRQHNQHRVAKIQQEPIAPVESG